MTRTARIEKAERKLKLSDDPYELDRLSSYELNVAVYLLESEILARPDVDQVDRIAASERLEDLAPLVEVGSERFRAALEKVDAHLGAVWASQRTEE